MTKSFAQLFGGLLLIAAGVLTFAETSGYIDLDLLAPGVWVAIFGILSLLSFVAYFTAGLKRWGWLFPAGIFGALALIVTLGILGVHSSVIGVPLFAGLALPFITAFALDRKRNWWALIPTGVFAFLSFVLIAVDTLRAEWIGSALLGFIALGSSSASCPSSPSSPPPSWPACSSSSPSACPSWPSTCSPRPAGGRSSPPASCSPAR
jgi:hypothetical protein